ncbi:unnamed protein product [Lymnaea stagnalis]|uniref:Uncharacterized protein n=1 Tax=Lymnaea stagnalis TaxID=6523 RepID=A0AAV2HIL9_LYMST
MDIFVSLILTLVFVASSNQQQQDMRLARKGNDFIASAGMDDNTQGSCYDRCYDAYLIGREVIGCACSQYDFNGRNSVQNCNCPAGSICQQSLGKRNCVPRSDIGGQMIGGGRYGSGAVKDGKPGAPVSSGPNQGENVCGVPPVNCLTKNNGFNAISKFAYDPRLRTCVKILVYVSCTPVKLFDSQPECLRFCTDINMGY